MTLPSDQIGDVAAIDHERLLDTIETLSSQRSVAARIVSATDSEDVSARELSRLLSTDVPLAGRVMKLANSATFGMRGRVDSLQFAVTVIGFTTVRTMATVAMMEHDDSHLPDDFWTATTHLALAASTVATRFGLRTQDGLCIGLLAGMGPALLHHNDPHGYRSILDASSSWAARRSSERRRYGATALQLSALALERWSFPHSVITPVHEVENSGSLDGALLRVALETTGRLTEPDYAPQAVVRLSCGRMTEKDLAPVLHQVYEHVAELRQAILDD